MQNAGFSRTYILACIRVAFRPRVDGGAGSLVSIAQLASIDSTTELDQINPHVEEKQHEEEPVLNRRQ